MTINADDLRAAGAARRSALQGKTLEAGYRGQRVQLARSADVMGGTAKRCVGFPAQMRAKTIERDGKAFYEVSGYATAYDQPYDMWDMFGPYEESVAAGAATDTLAAKPDVVFLVNHTGLALARTINGTLELGEDDHGLADTAFLNPERQDARDLVTAIEDGVITEQSFAFRIDEGWWNDDFTEFKIMKFDIHRGDTSAVNYGANPHTDIAARQQELLRMMRGAPDYLRLRVRQEMGWSERVLDSMLERAEGRAATHAVGGSTSRWQAMLDLWAAEDSD